MPDQDNVINGPWSVDPPSDTEIICTLEEPLKLDADAIALATEQTAVHRTLRAAVAAGLTDILVIGRRPDGSFYFDPGHNTNAADILFFLWLAEKRVEDVLTPTEMGYAE